ncbi:hypothetical protein TIFTF001_002035 [Ficus carica]|uniref:Zinc finger PHD-type domain-containing protein n=1 Tax=Ficus carica TaxID=3494 RepID=A0AA87Z9Q2_FICCA|nr:hypothetical protein TIFTF001_002035 [Ficus carica]
MWVDRNVEEQAVTFPKGASCSRRRKENQQQWRLHLRKLARRGRECQISSLSVLLETSTLPGIRLPFRDKVKKFLQQCTEAEDYEVHRMSIWRTLLVHEKSGVHIPLYTVEELLVNNSTSERYCDRCRITGWRNLCVTKKTYHFIISIDEEWNKSSLDEDVFNLKSHLLYGVVHGDGCGHLVCINGIEGGSKYIFGSEIMDFWVRICKNLQVRKITVEDVSKKKSMELRLLFGIAYGNPWFGKSEYEFFSGSFGVKESDYKTSIKNIQSLELDAIVKDFSNTQQGKEIERIISMYRDWCEARLRTFQDLLRFMLTIKSRAIKKSITAASAHLASCSSSAKTVEDNISVKLFSTVASSKLKNSRWTQSRLEETAKQIMTVLWRRRLATVLKMDEFLGNKHFIKDWPLGDEEDHALTFFCISDDDKSEAGVTVQLQEYTEVLNLKCEVANALSDTYDIPHVPDFQIVGLEGLNNEEELSGKVKSDAELRVTSEGLVGLLKRHGDFKERDVVCKCGAMEDDGESLMQCKSCDSWQHRRCHNIKDTENDPWPHLCTSCLG